MVNQFYLFFIFTFSWTFLSFEL